MDDAFEPEDHRSNGAGGGGGIGSGYITDDDFKRVQTDLEMSDDDEGAGVTSTKKRKKRRRHRFREEDDDDSDMDTELDSVRKQLKQRHSESVQERTANHTESIVRLVKASASGKISSGTDRKCLLCNQVILESKVMGHLSREHGNDYSLKCKDCDFRSSKKQIVQHIRQEHNGRGTVVKIIVAGDDTEPTVIESVNVLMANVRTKDGDVVRKSIAPTMGLTSSSSATEPFAIARKRRKSVSASTKNDREKGHLMRKMNEMTFLGPGRNERTAKSTAAAPTTVPPRDPSP